MALYNHLSYTLLTWTVCFLTLVVNNVYSKPLDKVDNPVTSIAIPQSSSHDQDELRMPQFHADMRQQQDNISFSNIPEENFEKDEENLNLDSVRGQNNTHRQVQNSSIITIRPSHQPIISNNNIGRIIEELYIALSKAIDSLQQVSDLYALSVFGSTWKIVCPLFYPEEDAKQIQLLPQMNWDVSVNICDYDLNMKKDSMNTENINLKMILEVIYQYKASLEFVQLDMLSFPMYPKTRQVYFERLVKKLIKSIRNLAIVADLVYVEIVDQGDEPNNIVMKQILKSIYNGTEDNGKVRGLRITRQILKGLYWNRSLLDAL